MVPPQGSYMAPPHAPYMSPDQFYGHPSPFVVTEIPPNASVDAVNSTRKRACSEAADTSPPAKRGRGRPRKVVNDDVPAKAKASVRRAKPKAQTKTKAVKKDKSNQENLPPVINIMDSDDELEKDEGGKPRFWTAEEKTRFFEFFLGPDADAERRFKQHKVNPGHVYKRASELFHGARTADSVKSLYVRSLDTFTWMRAFNSFTGTAVGTQTRTILRLSSRARSRLHVARACTSVLSNRRQLQSERGTGGMIYSIIALALAPKLHARLPAALHRPYQTSTTTT
ncbi:hypothetical protein B0H13DRAFT_2667809 [Mycena leptocephala]|nr:hypothetical protein B0H13DRAFT_2667809 [Mycena leptocephala]